MKHTVTVVFGKEQVIKINNGEELTSDELRLNVKNILSILKMKNAHLCAGLMKL